MSDDVKKQDHFPNVIHNPLSPSSSQIFVKAALRIRTNKFGLAFDRWKMMSDWMAFTEKFWGTAVERAVKRSYLRWACARWHDKVMSRRHRRAVLRRLFKRSAAGLLTWAWGRLKPVKARKEWKPRKLGLCR